MQNNHDDNNDDHVPVGCYSNNTTIKYRWGRGNMTSLLSYWNAINCDLYCWILREVQKKLLHADECNVEVLIFGHLLKNLCKPKQYVLMRLWVRSCIKTKVTKKSIKFSIKVSEKNMENICHRMIMGCFITQKPWIIVLKYNTQTIIIRIYGELKWKWIENE